MPHFPTQSPIPCLCNRLREDQLRKAREHAVRVQKDHEDQQASQPKPSKIKYGEAGYRWHASIPQVRS